MSAFKTRLIFSVSLLIFYSSIGVTGRKEVSLFFYPLDYYNMFINLDVIFSGVAVKKLFERLK